MCFCVLLYNVEALQSYRLSDGTFGVFVLFFFCVVSGDLFHQFYSGSPHMCCRFMENLQSEVLELEFKEFSKGMPTISEVDFARILLRYTLLDRSEINECVERVRERVPHEKVRYKQYEHGLSNSMII